MLTVDAHRDNLWYYKTNRVKHQEAVTTCASLRRVKTVQTHAVLVVVLCIAITAT